jgi:AbiV family abortive infection protein
VRKTRRFRNRLDVVFAGIAACRANAADLLASAHHLADLDAPAPALSLAVLALEEMGKLLFIDGLLFASATDHKAEAFQKGFRGHAWKLARLDVFPFAIRSFGSHSPRLQADSAYAERLIQTIRDYQRHRQALAHWIGDECDLAKLDDWKQKGFYVQQTGSGFATPRQAIDIRFSTAVLALADSVVLPIERYLEENGAQYRDFADKIRSALTDEQWKLVTETAEREVEAIFAPDA